MNKYTFIRSNGSLERLVLDDILYIEASGNYSKVVMVNGRKFVASINLIGWMNKLSAATFCRISRGCVISLDHVEHIGKDTVRLKNTSLSLSDHYRKELMERLTILEGRETIQKKTLHAA